MFKKFKQDLKKIFMQTLPSETFQNKISRFTYKTHEFVYCSRLISDINKIVRTRNNHSGNLQNQI